MKEPHIQITTSGGGCNHTQVFIDGNKIDGVRKILFEREAGKYPILHLDIMAGDMEIDGDFIPALPKIFENWYVENPEIKKAPLYEVRNKD